MPVFGGKIYIVLTIIHLNLPFHGWLDKFPIIFHFFVLDLPINLSVLTLSFTWNFWLTFSQIPWNSWSVVWWVFPFLCLTFPILIYQVLFYNLWASHCLSSPIIIHSTLGLGGGSSPPRRTILVIHNRWFFLQERTGCIWRKLHRISFGSSCCAALMIRLFLIAIEGRLYV